MQKPMTHHVPETVLIALHEIPPQLRGVDLNLIVTAATWAFCRQDAATRRALVSEFWFTQLYGLEIPEAHRKPKTWKERAYALAASGYALLRGRHAR
jgi:hypothetical protein